jgi:hypothetical protein
MNSSQPKPLIENFHSQMNGAMSAKGHLSTTRYNRTMDSWYGRAYWISEELKPPHDEA